jgi:uncharacterized protein YjbI with pentapeptide repeats
METLTAFVRERAKWQQEVEETGTSDHWVSDAVSNSNARAPRREPDTDIAAVIAVIRRRPIEGQARERRRGWRFDLRATDLRGANLFEAHLVRAILLGAHLEYATLTRTHLERAILSGAHLERARLFGTNLKGAILTGAHLEHTMLLNTYLEHADLSLARLEHTSLIGVRLEHAKLHLAHLESADLSRVTGLTQAQIDQAYGNAETQLPEGLIPPKRWTVEQEGGCAGTVKPDQR